ncbi:MAG TPA: hypothetical protein VGN26_19385 [Armatimonadota bacterium]|jgi:hypothetical protein
MKLFGLDQDGHLVEFTKRDFSANHIERTLEDWLMANPNSILEETGLMMVGRQVNTNLGGFIDLLALDGSGNTVVVELKRDRTPRDVLAQALDYASYVATLDAGQLEQVYQSYNSDSQSSLVNDNRAYFQAEASTSVTLNRDQRIVLVGQDITPSIRQSSQYLCTKGLLITCVEFALHETERGDSIMAISTVVGDQPVPPVKVTSGPAKLTNKETFLSDCDESGAHVFGRILREAEEHGHTVKWGTKGFAVRMDVRGRSVGLLQCYPQQSSYSQYLYVVVSEIYRNLHPAPEELKPYLDALLDTGLLQSAGQDLRWVVKADVDETRLTKLLEELWRTAKWLQHRLPEEPPEVEYSGGDQAQR